MKNADHVWKVHVPAHFFGISAIVWAAFNPSWLLLCATLFGWTWFSGLGQSIGFHRYFTHRSFRANRFWQHVMLWGGTLAGQGSVVFWTALHRLHHPTSDTPPDIHSPQNGGFWHAYMGWIFSLDPQRVPLGRATDVIRDPVCRFTHRHYSTILRTWWITLIAIALFCEPLRPVVAGLFIAGLIGIHQEAIVNSVCHDRRFGTAPYAQRTSDYSRNVPLLHYLLWGQAYHHTHHAWPAAANFRCDTPHAKDIGFRIIQLIEQPPKRPHLADMAARTEANEIRLDNVAKLSESTT